MSLRNLHDDAAVIEDSVECWDCGGEGVTHHDCGEDCCMCLEPEDNVTCETCGGTGWLPLEP